jgi:nucleoside-diphosphate-sugar epimerase
MRILITGAAGMIGRKLLARLAADGTLAGKPITAVDLHDIVAPTPRASRSPPTKAISPTPRRRKRWWRPSPT